jgi:hypothetical protein
VQIIIVCALARAQQGQLGPPWSLVHGHLRAALSAAFDDL